MDFVVVGFGLGALIVLVGIAVRDLGPRLRRFDAPEPSGERVLGIYSIYHIPTAHWATACYKAGQAIMLGGGAIILAATGGIFAGVDNGDGARLVLAVALLAIGGIAIRVGMLANGLFPIERRARDRARQLALAQRAAQSAAVVTEQPVTAQSKADEAKPAAPVVPTAEAAEAVAIGPNGASAEPIPAEALVETAASSPQAGPESDDAPSSAEETASTPADGDAHVTTVEPSTVEAAAEIDPAQDAPEDADGDTRDQDEAAAAAQTETIAGEKTSDDNEQDSSDEQSGVTDEAERRPEAAASGRSGTEP